MGVVGGGAGATGGARRGGTRQGGPAPAAARAGVRVRDGQRGQRRQRGQRAMGGTRCGAAGRPGPESITSIRSRSPSSAAVTWKPSPRTAPACSTAFAQASVSARPRSWAICGSTPALSMVPSRKRRASGTLASSRLRCRVHQMSTTGPSWLGLHIQLGIAERSGHEPSLRGHSARSADGLLRHGMPNGARLTRSRRGHWEYQGHHVGLSAVSHPAPNGPGPGEMMSRP